jgi:phosphonate degradation associated HDIG domain protein
MTKVDIESILDDVFALYEKHGSEDYIGEPVSQIEHMSQAAELALEQGFDDEVVVAAFFHDIGHLCVHRTAANDLHGLGTVSHEKVGADYLREKGFPERVALLVESHVQAKRYLTARFPEYYNKLSDASKKTLEYQGGKMTEEEADQFERDPLFKEYVQMRQWDEQAKEMNRPVLPLPKVRDLARRVLFHSMMGELPL